MTIKSCDLCIYRDFATDSDTCSPCLAAPMMARPNWTPLKSEVADIEIDPEVVRQAVAAPQPAVDVRTYVADTAKRIVNGDRRGAYGTPGDNFARIARFWTAYFQNTGRDVTVTPQDVSPLMRLLKEARLCDNPAHLDSHVDLVGYALTGAEVAGVKIPD